MGTRYAMMVVKAADITASQALMLLGDGQWQASGVFSGHPVPGAYPLDEALVGTFDAALVVVTGYHLSQLARLRARAPSLGEGHRIVFYGVDDTTGEVAYQHIVDGEVHCRAVAAEGEPLAEQAVGEVPESLCDERFLSDLVSMHVQADIDAATFARYTESQTADAMVRKDKRGWWPFSGA